MAKLNIEHIYKSFSSNIIVNDFSFESTENEFLVLVGPSGCGKTTLLRMIAGLETASRGRIFLDGEPLSDKKPHQRDIAMVFQSYALYPNLTVFDNLAFPLYARNEKKASIKDKVISIANRMEISELLNRKPNTLSGGQRQRVAIGRALIREPKVFLLDEPLSNLDAALRERMRAEIVQLHKKVNAVFIYVTHDQIEAMSMGDRIIVMKDAQIQQIDSPSNIYRFPRTEFVAEFIGSPKMNFISKEMVHIICPNICLSDNVQIHSIGVRPEHIIIEKGDEHGPLCGRICHIEMLGKDVVYQIAYGDEVIRACLPSRYETDVCIGDTVICTVNDSNLHFFDNDGKRINSK